MLNISLMFKTADLHNTMTTCSEILKGDDGKER